MVFVMFTISYGNIFYIGMENFSRVFQVILQLSLYLLIEDEHLLDKKDNKDKEKYWLLIIPAFLAIVASLWLKNLISVEGILWIMVPVFFFFIICLPSDILPFSLLIFYSIDQGLLEWAICLLFQILTYSVLCIFFEK
jgi:hypothetical protein